MSPIVQTLFWMFGLYDFLYFLQEPCEISMIAPITQKKNWRLSDSK